MAEKFIDTALGFILLVAAIIILVPLASYIIGQATGLTPIKGGPILIAMLVVAVTVMLMFIVVKWGLPGAKWTVLYVGLLLGAAFFAIIKLPSWVPGLFSTVPVGGTMSAITLSPLTSVLLGAALIGGLYWYSKKR